METENPTFNFTIEYGGNAVDCDVIMQSKAYDIYFDGRSMGSIEHTEDGTWLQASGVILPDAIIGEIGLRVESQYQ